MATQWFVVPVEVSYPQQEEQALGDGARQYPKYSDTDGIDGYAGTIFHVPPAWGLPFSGQQFVVKFSGTDAALANVDSNSDSYGEGTDATQEQIAQFLNQRHTTQFTFDEWGERFGASRNGGGQP